MKPNEHFKAVAKSRDFVAYLLLSSISSFELKFLSEDEYVGYAVSFVLSILWATAITLVLNQVSMRFSLSTISTAQGIVLQFKIWLDWFLTVLLGAIIVSVPIALLGLILEFVFNLDISSSRFAFLQPLKPAGIFLAMLIFGIWHVVMYARAWMVRKPISGNAVKALAWVSDNSSKLGRVFVVLTFVSAVGLLARYLSDFTSQQYVLQSVELISGLTYSIFIIWALTELFEHRASFLEEPKV